MVKLEEKQNADIDDQIRYYKLLISSAAAEINIKDDVFDTGDQFSEEEASTSSEQEAEINSVKNEPTTDSSMELIEISDESENADCYADCLSMYCDDQTSLPVVKEETYEAGNADCYPDCLSMYCDDQTSLPAVKKETSAERLHEGFECDVCGENIIGFRYTCVQCNNFDLCMTCEARGSHPQHCMLRIPGPRSSKKAEAVLAKIRNYLESEADTPTPVLNNDIENISYRLTQHFKELNEKTKQANTVGGDVTEPNKSVTEDTAKRVLGNQSENNTNNNNNNMTSNNESSHNGPHVKKPLNAFMLFLKDMRTKMPTASGITVMNLYHKLIGRQWHNLSEEEQAVYYRKAKEERRLHKLRYPDWKNVRKPGSKKRLRNKNDDNKNKKCRAKYGFAYKDQWCDGCKRKKKCKRYKNTLAEAPDKTDLVIHENTSKQTDDALTIVNSPSNGSVAPCDMHLKQEPSESLNNPQTLPPQLSKETIVETGYSDIQRTV